MKNALLICRAMNAEGRHLTNCFASADKQAEGRQLCNRARRIVRRLGWKPEAILN